MKNLVLIILLSCFVFNSEAQFQLASLKTDDSKEDIREKELSPLTDLVDILNYIYKDPFRKEFVDNIPAGYPLKQEININSFYGARKHPVHQVLKFHSGIDLKGATGEIAIATGNGIVTEVGFKKDIGNYIRIKHKYGFETIYGHLSKMNVKKGQEVKKFQTIGLVGATGTVTGPHLHFTLKKNGQYLDPFDFIFMEFKEEL